MRQNHAFCVVEISFYPKRKVNWGGQMLKSLRLFWKVKRITLIGCAFQKCNRCHAHALMRLKGLCFSDLFGSKQ